MTKRRFPRGRSMETDTPRDQTMGVRLTKAEESMIAAAAPVGMKPSVWVRTLALAAVSKANRVK